MKKSILIFSAFITCFSFAQLKAQLIVQPSIESKTHPSMSIDSIVIGEGNTMCYFQLENQSTEGNAWFCADQDIVLIELSSGKEHLLIKTSGIPICPEVHKFKHKGERLFFSLEFPLISDLDGEIDIIEQCSDNCFSLKGILLDVDLNAEIRVFENGVNLFKLERFKEALSEFSFLENSKYKDENHYAYALYIIPVLHHKLGEKNSAKSAYAELRGSDIPQKLYFLEKIHEIPFFKELQE